MKTRTQVKGSGGRWSITVPDLLELRRLCVTSVGSAQVESLTLRVGEWDGPKGWIGDPRIPRVMAYSLTRRPPGVEIIIELGAPLDSSLVLAGCVRMLDPVGSLGVGPMITAAPGIPGSGAPMAASITDALVPGQDANPHLRRCDLLLVGDPQTAPEVERQSTVAIADRTWFVDGRPRTMAVDPSVHRPIGRRSEAKTAVLQAEILDGMLHLSDGTTNAYIAEDLTPQDAAALLNFGGIRAGFEIGERWYQQLQACGLVVSDGIFPAADDQLGWQSASVAARREGLREGSPMGVLDRWPSVSAVLLTNRPEFMRRALLQLERLTYPRLEIIVGLHGIDISKEERKSLRAASTQRLRFVDIDGSVPFGTAMQQACQAADGELITKLDDDDLYGPEHIWDLVLARMYSGATLVGKALDWIYLESRDCTVFRPAYKAEAYAPFVAGGTMLISRSDLDAVGGWRPVPKSIDRGLIEQVLASGGLIYRTHGLGYVYVRRTGPHTALVSDQHFLTKTEGQWPGVLAHGAFGT